MPDLATVPTVVGPGWRWPLVSLEENLDIGLDINDTMPPTRRKLGRSSECALWIPPYTILLLITHFNIHSTVFLQGVEWCETTLNRFLEY